MARLQSGPGMNRPFPRFPVRFGCLVAAGFGMVLMTLLAGALLAGTAEGGGDHRISGEETWSGRIVFADSIEVREGAKLTVADTIIVMNNSAPFPEILVRGTLIMNRSRVIPLDPTSENRYFFRVLGSCRIVESEFIRPNGLSLFSDDVSLSGNRIREARGDGVFIRGNGDPTVSPRISGNSISDPGLHGIRLEGTHADLLENAITGCGMDALHLSGARASVTGGTFHGVGRHTVFLSENSTLDVFGLPDLPDSSFVLGDDRSVVRIHTDSGIREITRDTRDTTDYRTMALLLGILALVCLGSVHLFYRWNREKATTGKYAHPSLAIREQPDRGASPPAYTKSDDIEAQVAFGDMAMSGGSYEAALKYYNDALEFTRTDDLLVRRGNALEKMRLYQEAFDNYEAVYRINPDNKDAIEGMWWLRDAVQTRDALPSMDGTTFEVRRDPGGRGRPLADGTAGAGPHGAGTPGAPATGPDPRSPDPVRGVGVGGEEDGEGVGAGGEVGDLGAGEDGDDSEGRGEGTGSDRPGDTPPGTGPPPTASGQDHPDKVGPGWETMDIFPPEDRGSDDGDLPGGQEDDGVPEGHEDGYKPEGQSDGASPDTQPAGGVRGTPTDGGDPTAQPHGGDPGIQQGGAGSGQTRGEQTRVVLRGGSEIPFSHPEHRMVPAGMAPSPVFPADPAATPRDPSEAPSGERPVRPSGDDPLHGGGPLRTGPRRELHQTHEVALMHRDSEPVPEAKDDDTADASDPSPEGGPEGTPDGIPTGDPEPLPQYADVMGSLSVPGLAQGMAGALAELRINSLYFEDRPRLLRQIALALARGKHIIFYGPPGTGKSSIAREVCESLGVEFAMVTGTSDWSTFDTIGGYMLEEDGSLKFSPGLFLRSLQDEGTPVNRWLIIDEINRADIDKTFGAMFSALAGNDVTLSHRIGGRQIEVIGKPRQELSITPNRFFIHPQWHILATMNTFDKSSLYEMSYAFMRRFSFISVQIPDDLDTAVPGLARVWGIEMDEIMRKRVTTLWKIINEYRRIGPAIVRDILFSVAETRDYTSAITMFVLPQFEGIEDRKMKRFKDAVIQQLSDVVDVNQLQIAIEDFFNTRM